MRSRSAQRDASVVPIQTIRRFCDYLQSMQIERQIEVVDYDPSWPEDFEREAVALREVFGGVATKIHHVGSTSVPNLRAKPTIDILVEVSKGTDIPGFDPLMEAFGFICRGECLDAIVPGTPGRFYYVRKEGVNHLVHVHVCAESHLQINEILAFRDDLRAHPEQAESRTRRSERALRSRAPSRPPSRREAHGSPTRSGVLPGDPGGSGSAG